MMELRVLRYFLTVASEDSITNAANILHITQPTLSRQLMQLEEELGVQLFVRGKKAITLTEAGMLLRSRAEEIVDLANRTEKEFLNQKNFLSGEIFIGAGETSGMKELARIIKSFNKEYPQVKYDLHSGNADDIKEKIDKGLIDIGLLTEPVDIGKYEFVRLKEKDNWGVAMRKDDPLSNNEYITPRDLKNKSIVCSKRISIQNELANWFGNDFESGNIIATFNLINNAIAIVESNIGYAICLESLVSDRSNICFKSFYPRLETGSVLVWKKNQIFSTATKMFIEEIKKEFK